MLPLLAAIALALALTLALPASKRALTAASLESDLGGLTLTTAHLQIYTRSNGADMDAAKYVDGWTGFNGATQSVADSIAGTARFEGDDAASVRAALKTFVDTHTCTLGQLGDVARSVLSADERAAVGGLVEANRDQCEVISDFVSDPDLDDGDDSAARLSEAFDGAISALG